MSQSPGNPEFDAALQHLMQLQDSICEALEAADGQAKFDARVLDGERGGMARPRALSDGAVFERAAVNLSCTRGASLPPAATALRPQLAGRGFEARSLSLIVHPVNPHIPTTHANFRLFVAGAETDEPVWWFGGGFDLTPYYGYAEDAREWHQVAKDACDTLDSAAYARYKKTCDEYFYLPHRDEPRGIGGIFFDDLNEPDFDRCFGFWKAASSSFLRAYMPIVERRRDTEYGAKQRDWQLMRRGRYVEFNLLYDRGTRYGLEAGGRTESILASLPPLVSWCYDHAPEDGSPEARLMSEFLTPREWI